MKTPVKSLVLVAFLSIAAGAAQADTRNCPTAPQPATTAQMSPMEMGKLEAALRAGQITPYEAGRLMRQQWEMAQFQRGFLEGATTPHAAGGGGCGGMGTGMDMGAMKELAGGMAKNGMETAATLMRALRRETERLLKERAAVDEEAL